MNTQHLKQRASAVGSSSLAISSAHPLGASTSIDERPEAEAAAAEQLAEKLGAPMRARASLQPVYEPRHYLASCAPIQFIPWARSLDPASLSAALASNRRKSCSWAPQEPGAIQCVQCVQRLASAPDGSAAAADPLGVSAGLQHPGILRRYSCASSAGWLEQLPSARGNVAGSPQGSGAATPSSASIAGAAWAPRVSRRPSSQLVITSSGQQRIKDKTQASQELKVAQARHREHQVYSQQASAPHTCRRHTLAR